jgi:hypothetical protein
MFFVELKPAPNNKDIFLMEYLQQCKIEFEPPKHKREITHVQTANVTDTPRITAILNPDAPNAPVVTTPHISVTERTDQKMSNVSSVVATTQPIIRVARYTKSSKKKKSTHPYDPNNIFLRLLSHKPFTPPLEYLTLKSPQTSHPPLHPPIKFPKPSPPLPQTADIHDLKHMIKQL